MQWLQANGQYLPTDIRRLAWDDPVAGGEGQYLDDARVEALLRSVERRPLTGLINIVVWDCGQPSMLFNSTLSFNHIFFHISEGSLSSSAAVLGATAVLPMVHKADDARWPRARP